MTFDEEPTECNGRIFLFDFANASKPQEVRIDWHDRKEKFAQWNPHGIDAIATKTSGQFIVFVVNHHPHEAIERFRFDMTTMTMLHWESIKTKSMHLMNSVVAIDERSFFFTNTNYFRSPVFLRNLESLADVGSGSVGSYHGKTFESALVYQGLSVANGVAYSHKYHKLYVINFAKKELVTFSVCSLKSIKVESVVYLGTLGDNIQIDEEDNSLWIAAHPVPMQAFTHMSDNTIDSPSQVIQVKVDSEGRPRADKIRELFLDRGSLISGSSVALRHKNQMLIGSITTKTAICNLISDFPKL